MSRSLLITPSHLSALLARKGHNIKLLDASWHMPNLTPARIGYNEYKSRRIAGAVFWNVDVIAEPSKEMGLSHMLPSGKKFVQAAQRLGIDRSSHVVVYDSTSLFSAPRTAATFAAYGHETISILDGGLPRWIAEGHPLAKESESDEGLMRSMSLYENVETEGLLKEGEYNGGMIPEVNPQFIVSYEEVVKESQKDWQTEKAAVIIDARPAARFLGTAPEPRPGLSSGSIPHSCSVPFSNVLSSPSTTTPVYQTLLPRQELIKVFTKSLGTEQWARVERGENPIITTCGSGMTAAVLWLALKEAGVERGAAIYDESWTGYASRKESVIVKS